jgi:hypothetical protein
MTIRLAASAKFAQSYLEKHAASLRLQGAPSANFQPERVSLLSTCHAWNLQLSLRFILVESGIGLRHKSRKTVEKKA